MRQDLGERIELFFDGHYGFRETDNWHQPGAQNAAVHALTDSDQINMSAGVDYSVTPSWSMLADVAYGYSHSRLTNSLNSRSDYRSRVTTFRATANGPLMSLPAGDLKIAFGVDVRRERNSRVDPYLDAIAPTPPLDRDVDAAFLEFSLPIFDALTASLAGRHERYSDFGSTTNPKLGLSWDVTSELTVRGTFSTSFSVSRLADSLTGFNIGFIQEIESPRCDDNRCLVLSDLGYRDSYDPERAKTYNIGFDYSPHWAEGLAVQASYYRIKYIDRIGHLPNRSVLLNNAHRFSEVVMSSPPGAFVETTIDRMMRGYVNGALDLVGAYDVNDFDYFIDERMTNLAESETDGLDLAIGYSRPWGERTIGIELAGTYILDYTNTAFPTSPSTPGINRVGLPSDLKLTAAFSLSTPRYAINLLLRHIGDYIDDRAAQSFKVSSWTTADLHASFSVGDRFGGRADDLVLAVTLRNMFDRDPPYVRGDGFYDFGYDSANASAEGRVLAVDVRKRW